MATQEDYDRLGGWAVMLNTDLKIDRRKCSRTVPMQVLSFGAPRTATLSMSEAYETLGIPSYHYSSLFANCRDSDMWLEALEAKYNTASTKKPYGRTDFDKLLGHVGAVTDAPCILFWRELLEAYPEAKVVLVERDEEKWLSSIRGLVEGVLNPVGRHVLRRTDPQMTGRILNLGMAWIRYLFGVQHLSVGAVMENARQTYRSHYAEVRATVPAQRLLDYKLGSGWEPLCQFLGKDVPKEAFPRRNDAPTLDLAFGTFLKKAFINSLFNLGIVVGVLAVVAGVADRLTG